jgi:hypothetical protein
MQGRRQACVVPLQNTSFFFLDGKARARVGESFRIMEDPMLETIVLAGALFVCPGDVYSDTPRAGCHPLQDSSKEGFSTVKEAPEFDSKTPMPEGSDGGKAAKDSQSRTPAASEQDCAVYEEWVKLSTKSSSIGARDLSPGEFERWTNLKQVFGNSPPPNCR